MSWVALASEDELSEAVGCVLLSEAQLELGQLLRGGGFGYLKARIRNFCEMSRVQPILLLTDLDSVECAPTLMADWFRVNVRPENFVFRVSVREIEAWLLADAESIAQFLSIDQNLVPESDLITDPKAALLDLARRAPKELRADLLAPPGAMASQGIGYNSRLTDFVLRHWRPSRAAARSDSLKRARQRLAELKGREAAWTQVSLV